MQILHNVFVEAPYGAADVHCDNETVLRRVVDLLVQFDASVAAATATATAAPAAAAATAS